MESLLKSNTRQRLVTPRPALPGGVIWEYPAQAGILPSSRFPIRSLEKPDSEGQFLLYKEGKLFCCGEVTVDLRVIETQEGVDVVPTAIEVSVLAFLDDLPLLQNTQVLLHRGLADAGLPGDGGLAGPAVALAPGAADQIGVDQELDWCQSEIEDVVGQPKNCSLGG